MHKILSSFFITFLFIYATCEGKQYSSDDTSTHFFVLNYSPRIQQMRDMPFNNWLSANGMPKLRQVHLFNGFNVGYCWNRFYATAGLALSKNESEKIWPYELNFSQMVLSLEVLYRLHHNRFFDVYAGTGFDLSGSSIAGAYTGIPVTENRLPGQNLPNFDIGESSFTLSPRLMIWHRLSDHKPVLKNFRVGAEFGYAMRLIPLATNSFDFGPYDMYDNPNAFDSYIRPPKAAAVGNIFPSGFFFGLQLQWCIDRSYFFYPKGNS